MDGELADIVSDGDYAELEPVLADDPSLAADWRFAGTRTRLIHCVAHSDDANKLWLVLRHGGDVTARDERGWTLLHCASHYGAANTAAALIHQLAARNLPLDTGQTPLFLAINDQSRGSVGGATVVGLLIRARAPFDVLSAVVTGQVAIVRNHLLAAPPPSAPSAVEADYLS